MSETADFDPGPWRGHDFGSARRSYDATAGRSYGDAKAKKKVNADLLPKNLTTDSKSPLVIVCDVTGSMGEWPATIFSKLPYLEIEGREYLGDDMEICFAAVGDIFCDEYPLQARPFTKGTALKDELAKLVIEAKGGDAPESYDMAALYFARNVSMPKAFRPILIMIGDELMHEVVDPVKAEELVYAKVTGRITVESIFEELKQKYSVYYIRKGDTQDSRRDPVHKRWAELIGEDHIVPLPEAGRVVDVIFGILAKETDRVDYFRKEIEGRQKLDQVETVYKSLRSVHGGTAKGSSAGHTGKSIMRKTKSKTKPSAKDDGAGGDTKPLA